jgi:hypothetical protein
MTQANRTSIEEQRRMGQHCEELGAAQQEFLGKFQDRVATLRMFFNNLQSGAAVDRVAVNLQDCSKKVSAVVREIAEGFQEQAQLYSQYVAESEQEMARLEGQVAEGPSGSGGATQYGGPTGLAVGTSASSYNIS